MTNEPFWMVWNPNAGRPTMKHASRQLAESEAERLARKCPGETFIVLQAVSARKVDDMQRIEFVDPPEMPF